MHLYLHIFIIVLVRYSKQTEIGSNGGQTNVPGFKLGRPCVENQSWEINANKYKLNCKGCGFKSDFYTAVGKASPYLFSIQLPYEWGKWCNPFLAEAFEVKVAPNSLCSLIWELLILQVSTAVSTEGFLSADGCNSTAHPLTVWLSWGGDNHSPLVSLLLPFSIFPSPLVLIHHTWKAKLRSGGLLELLWA